MFFVRTIFCVALLATGAVQGGESLPAPVTSPKDLLARPPLPALRPASSSDQWLRLDAYNFCNPLKGVVLRFHEDERSGDERTWSAYRLDLKTQTCAALGPIGAPFIEELGKGPTTSVFRAAFAQLLDDGETIVLDCNTPPVRNETRDARAPQEFTWTWALYRLNPRAGKKEELARHAVTYSASARLTQRVPWSYDARRETLWYAAQDATGTANIYCQDLAKHTRRDAHPLGRQSWAGPQSFPVLDDGAPVLGVGGELRRVQAEGAPQAVKLPEDEASAPYLYAFTRTPNGHGLLGFAHTLGGKTLGAALYELDSITEPNAAWRKRCDIPDLVGVDAGGYYASGLQLVASADGAQIYFARPQSQAAAAALENGEARAAGFDGKYELCALDTQKGEVRVVWTSDDVNGLFYAHRAEARRKALVPEKPELQPTPVALPPAVELPSVKAPSAQAPVVPAPEAPPEKPVPPLVPEELENLEIRPAH